MLSETSDDTNKDLWASLQEMISLQKWILLPTCLKHTSNALPNAFSGRAVKQERKRVCGLGSDSD